MVGLKIKPAKKTPRKETPKPAPTKVKKAEGGAVSEEDRLKAAMEQRIANKQISRKGAEQYMKDRKAAYDEAKARDAAKGYKYAKGGMVKKKKK